MPESPTHLPALDASVLDLATFDNILNTYPETSLASAPGEAGWMRVEKGPPVHLGFSQATNGRAELCGDLRARVYERPGGLGSDARTPAQLALIHAVVEALRPKIDEGQHKWLERMAAVRALPAYSGKVLSPGLFAELLEGNLRIDDATDVCPEAHPPRSYGRPPSLLFVRRMVPALYGDRLNKATPVERAAYARNGFHRVQVFDDAGTLRTSAAEDEDVSFVEELAGMALPALERMRRERKARIAAAIAAIPNVDRDALAEAATAITHGKADIEPIVEAVLFAVADPVAYVKAHGRDRGFFLQEPVANLHTMAFLQNVPDAFAFTFDWKESVVEVLPLLARLLQDGPGVAFDQAPFVDRCAAWDRKNRLKALQEIAPSLSGAVLLHLAEGDSHWVACVRTMDAPRVAIWKRKTRLLFKLLA